MKKWITILFAFSLVLLLSGCAGGAKAPEEEKLYAWQGIGIISFGPQGGRIGTPASQTYLRMIIRNNAAGMEAKDVLATIDNVAPFKIRDESGAYHSPDELRSTSESPLFDDVDKYYSQHFIRNIYSDEEMELTWLVRAPTTPELAGNVYTHKLYATVQYNYSIGSSVNIIAISQDEVARRRNAGEEWEIRGETTNTAGDLKIDTSFTTQPIIFSKGASPEYYLKFIIKNVGEQNEGMPSGKVNVTVVYPSGVWVNKPVAEGSDYGWDSVDLAENVANRLVDATGIILGKAYILPFEIREIDSLNSGGVSQKTYTFFVKIDYTYLISTETEIELQPI